MPVQPYDIALVHAPKERHVSPEYGFTSTINFMPMGLFSIAAHLESLGFRTRIIHLGVESINGNDAEAVARRIRDAGVKLVGVSLHWHPSTWHALSFAARVKALAPRIPVVFGGMTASFYAQEMFEFAAVDYVIQGDGEHAMGELATSLLRRNGDRLDAVPNLWRRDPLTSSPLAPTQQHTDTAEQIATRDFSRLDLVDGRDTWVRLHWKLPVDAPLTRSMILHRPMHRPFTLYIARGCQISCPNCGASFFTHKTVFNRTTLNPVPVPQLLKVVSNALDLGFTRFTSSTGYGLPDDHYLEMFEGLRRFKNPVLWSTDFIKLPTVAMAREYARSVAPGSQLGVSLESGSERIRKLYRGPASFANDDLMRLVEALTDTDLRIQAFFIPNIPGDRATAFEHIEESRKMQQRLARFRNVDVYNYEIQLDPASPMQRHPEYYHCTPHWNSLRDYYEAHSRADSGPCFTPHFTPPPGAWSHINTTASEVVSRAVERAASLERRARQLYAASRRSAVEGTRGATF